MDNGRRFTYIWTTKNTNNGRNYFLQTEDAK